MYSQQEMDLCSLPVCLQSFDCGCSHCLISDVQMCCSNGELLAIEKEPSKSPITEYILKNLTLNLHNDSEMCCFKIYRVKTNLLTVCNLPEIISVSDCRKYQLFPYKQE